MYNWSTDVAELKKDRKRYTIWHLEQMVNLGLCGGKIKREEIKRYWPVLSLDRNKKKYLAMLLWPKRS